MPGFGSTGQHECRSGDGRTDLPFVEQCPAGLQSGTQDGVRRASDQQAARSRFREQCPRVIQAGRQRLLVVDMLTGPQGRHGHLGVGGGHGEVYHHIHLGIGQQLLDPTRAGYTVLFGPCPGKVEVEVGDGHDGNAEFRQVFQVNAGNVTAADDACPHTESLCID